MTALSQEGHDGARSQSRRKRRTRAFNFPPPRPAFATRRHPTSSPPRNSMKRVANKTCVNSIGSDPGVLAMTGMTALERPHHILGVRGFRGHIVSKRGINVLKPLRHHFWADRPRRQSTAEERLAPESRVASGRASGGFKDASRARPRRVRELPKRRKLPPIPSIFGRESGLIKGLSATLGQNSLLGPSSRPAAAFSASIDRSRTAAGGTVSTEPDKRRSPSGIQRENEYRTASLPWQEIVCFFEGRRDAGKSPNLPAKRIAVRGKRQWPPRFSNNRS